MKKIITVFLLIFLLGLSSPAYAALGFFKPTSKLYFLQPALESVKLFFTFSKEAKTDYLLQLTDRRTDEMALEQSTSTVNRYQANFAKLEKLATTVKDSERVVEKIKEASLRQQEVLAKVYSQVPVSAQAAIMNAQENSAKHVEKMIESAQNGVKAKEYRDQTNQIRQIERLGQQNKIDRVLLEGTPQAIPEGGIPRELNAGQELKTLNPVGESVDAAIVPPAAPVSIQPLQ